MTSAKRTPRYVEAIPSNLRIVGPVVEAQVIPIRRITPAFLPAIDPPVLPFPAPRRAVRKNVPVARRPWRVLLVPPTPAGRTRSFDVARWQARGAVASLALLLVIGGGAVTAIVAAVRAPDLFVGSADVAELRDQLLDVQDSLALVRAELLSARTDLSEPAGGIGSTLVAPPASGAASRPAIPSATGVGTAARKPLAARPPRATSSAADVPLMPRSLEGLPVIGRIASTFSRSRRHPILHIIRPHLGVDLAAPRGTRISAPAAGRVTFVGHKFGFGLVVEIRHTATVSTRYAHMRAATVHTGDQVGRGMQIGTVGSSGITTGPHLHYEIIVNGRQVDPLRYRLPQPLEGAAAKAASAPPPPVTSVAPLTPTSAASPPAPFDAPAAGARNSGGSLESARPPS